MHFKSTNFDVDNTHSVHTQGPGNRGLGGGRTPLELEIYIVNRPPPNQNLSLAPVDTSVHK